MQPEQQHDDMKSRPPGYVADILLFRPLSRHIEPRDARPSGSDPASAAIVALWGACPWSDEFTDYDRKHIFIYARLLHDESEGASEDDLALNIFGLDPYRNRGRVLRILRSHLNRARWLADTIFPMLGL